MSAIYPPQHYSSVDKTPVDKLALKSKQCSQPKFMHVILNTFANHTYADNFERTNNFSIEKT